MLTPDVRKRKVDVKVPGLFAYVRRKRKETYGLRKGSCAALLTSDVRKYKVDIRASGLLCLQGFTGSSSVGFSESSSESSWESSSESSSESCIAFSNEITVGVLVRMRMSDERPPRDNQNHSPSKSSYHPTGGPCISPSVSLSLVLSLSLYIYIYIYIYIYMYIEIT